MLVELRYILAGRCERVDRHLVEVELSPVASLGEAIHGSSLSLDVGQWSPFTTLPLGTAVRVVLEVDGSNEEAAP